MWWVWLKRSVISSLHNPGAKDLSDLVCDADEVLLVGITCGLSAPYVAGQIDHAMLHQVNQELYVVTRTDIPHQVYQGICSK